MKTRLWLGLWMNKHLSSGENTFSHSKAVCNTMFDMIVTTYHENLWYLVGLRSKYIRSYQGCSWHNMWLDSHHLWAIFTTLCEYKFDFVKTTYQMPLSLMQKMTQTQTFFQRPVPLSIVFWVEMSIDCRHGILLSENMKCFCDFCDHF